ncbi:MAG: hypothetical protein ACFB3T_03755 [Geminicoccaceae bacterium]
MELMKAWVTNYDPGDLAIVVDVDRAPMTVQLIDTTEQVAIGLTEEAVIELRAALQRALRVIDRYSSDDEASVRALRPDDLAS